MISWLYTGLHTGPNAWPYTGPYTGLCTGPYTGLYTGPYTWPYTGPYTEPCTGPYYAGQKAWHLARRQLVVMGVFLWETIDAGPCPRVVYSFDLFCWSQ